VVARPKEKRRSGRPRHGWDNNIKMNPEDIVRGCGLDLCCSGFRPEAGSGGHLW
jgi:hypothetical protein